MPAPRLQTLNLHGYIFDFSLVGVLIGQLTTLEIGSPVEAGEFITILSIGKNLVRCRVEQLVGTIPSDRSWENPVLLRFLEVLDIGGWGAHLEEEPSPPLTQVLKYIQTPSLNSLHLRRDRGWSLVSFTTFLQRSACNILHLTFDIPDSNEDEKIECLKLVPDLKTLDMRSQNRWRGGPDAQDFFTEALADSMKELHITNQQPSFVICPKLEEIHIDYDAIYDHSDAETIFANMVQMRLHWSPLRYVYIWDVQEEKSEQADFGHVSFEIIRLLVLKKYGLRVVLNPEPSWAVLFR